MALATAVQGTTQGFQAQITLTVHNCGTGHCSAGKDTRVSGSDHIGLVLQKAFGTNVTINQGGFTFLTYQKGVLILHHLKRQQNIEDK